MASHVLNKISLPFHHHDKEGQATHQPGTSSGPKSSISKSTENDQTLHTILPSPELQLALTQLVATITTQMRTDITAIFDPRFVDVPLAKPVDPNPPKDPKLDSSKVEVADATKAQKRREDIVEELSRPEVQELKKAVLAFYDSWKDRVLTRVGEVVDTKEQAKAQAKEAEAVQTTAPGTSAKDEDKKLTAADLDVKPKTEEAKAKEAKEEEEKDDDQYQINEEAEKMLPKLYPPTATALTKDLTQDQRRVVLHSLMLLILSLENYAAYSRILLLNLYSSLEVPLTILSADENNTARTLLTAVELTADAETKKKAEDNSHSRAWKVGLATVAGAAIIGVTGGLAAPLIAAGIGEVLGGVGLGATVAAEYLGTMAGSSLLVGGLFGAYGGNMTGKIMDEYAKEVEDFAFIPIRRHHRPRKIEKEHRRLRVCIGISGWLTEKEEVVKPWDIISPTIEGFALRWELEALLRLGNAITGMLTTTAWVYAKKQLIKRSIFGVLFEAAWPLKLIHAAEIIDNPFSVGLAKADQAGDVLADALCNKIQGERPVTLIGYSLGARMIRRCLLKLAERKAFGLIESVVLLGAPAPADSWEFRQMRSVVAGRLVNVYSENDLILAFLYRSSSLEYGVAGLQDIEGVKGVENIDVSDIVSGHLRYRFLSGVILKRIGFEDLDIARVEDEEASMIALEEELEKKNKEHEEKMAKEGKSEDDEVNDVKKNVEKQTHEMMADWAKSQYLMGKDAVTSFLSRRKDDDDSKDASKAPPTKT
jgi:hypothetical protein